MVKVGVEILALWYIDIIGRLEVVSSEDVVDVVDTTWSHSDLGEIGR